MKLRACIFLIVLHFITTKNWSQSSTPLADLDEHIIPVSLQNFEDAFVHLLPTFETAEVVGVGEATHGTSEIIRFKSALFEQLVKHQNFRVLIMESFFADTQILNAYVNGGEGDIRNIILKMGYGIYYTEEMLDLIQWIRTYNQRAKEADRISVFGCDVPQPRYTIRLLKETFVAHEIDYSEELLSYLSSINGRTRINQKKADEIRGELDQFKNDLNHILKGFELELHLQYIRTIEQFIDLRASHKKSDAGLRDQFMAENASWIIDQVKKKSLVWAHNEHIAKIQGNRGIIPMGNYLDRKYKYLSIGTAIHSGMFRANEVFSIPEIEGDSYDNYFSKLSEDFFFLNFESFSTGEDSILKASNRSISIGASFNGSNEYSYIREHKIMESYDAIMFFKFSNPVNVLGGLSGR